MIANGPSIERDRAAFATGRRPDAAHPSPPKPHVGARDVDLAALVPASAAVLWLGPIDPDLSRELESRSCRVSAIPAGDGDDPDGVHPHWADLGRLDLGRDRFDVAVLPDALGRAREPEAILDAIRRSLRTGGRLVASVPNAAHPSVRRALALGLGPYGGSGPLDAGQLRLFTRETLAVAIEDAGFAVGRLIPLGDEAGEGDGDEDGAAAWLAVAYPLPVPGLDVIQARFREEARARDEAEREARQLRGLLAQTRIALDAAHHRAEELSARERATRAAMIEAHEALLQRDEEFRATTRDLLGRLDEAGPLRLERDAAHRHALAAEARCRALELRAEHVLMEFPRRLARRLRRLIQRRGS